MSTKSYALCIYCGYKYLDDRNENGGRRTIFSPHLRESPEPWDCARVLDTEPRGCAVLLHRVAAILREGHESSLQKSKVVKGEVLKEDIYRLHMKVKQFIKKI